MSDIVTQVMRAVLISAALIVASTALARQALNEDPTVNNGLRAIAVADEIRENCGSISARMLRAVGFIQSIKSHAEAQGFSDAEIDAFVEDNGEKDRLKAEARTYMSERGVVSGNEASYCALGSAEIAADSQIGALLRSR